MNYGKKSTKKRASQLTGKRTKAKKKFGVAFWKSLFVGIREFDSCIIKIVRAGRIKPVLFLSSFSIYYLVIFSDM